MYNEVCLYDLLQEKKTKKKKHSSTVHQFPHTSVCDPNDMVPARTAVFTTNEILSLILSNVSKEDIDSSRCVCRLWNTVARSIKIHVLSPIHLYTDTVHAYPEYCEDGQFVDINPAVTVFEQSWKMESYKDVCHMEFSVNCDFISSDLRRLGCELLTRPPITQIALTTGSLAKLDNQSSDITLLNVSDGIRLWHLAEAFRKLRRGAGVQPCRRECKGHFVSAHLICEKIPLLTSDYKTQLAIFEWMETIE